MRQAGVVAAGALYALDHHVERLAEDHRLAKVIAEAVTETPELRLVPPEVETNLVWFDIERSDLAASAFAENLKQHGILVHVAGRKTLRACTHLDVTARTGRAGCECDSPNRPQSRWSSLIIMRIRSLHSWNMTPKEAVALQRELASRIDSPAA